MDLLDGLRAFVATAESGSFTGAAERLGVSNRLTSKYVAALEARLGTRLLQRTTRRVGLTPAGEELLARAPAVLEDLDTLIADVSERSQGFSGQVRISAPVTLGEVYFQDMLRRFAEPHPELVIDLRLNDAHADLARDGIDLAFRIGEPGAQAMKARLLGHVDSVLIASPAYLSRHSVPREPEDLAQAACVIDTNRRNPARWTFRRGAEARVVTVSGRFRVNSARAVRDLVLAGQGVGFCPHFVLDDHVATGRLVPLLTEWRGPEIPVNAVYLEGRRLPGKLRALMDFARTDMRASGVFSA